MKEYKQADANFWDLLSLSLLTLDMDRICPGRMKTLVGCPHFEMTAT